MNPLDEKKRGDNGQEPEESVEEEEEAEDESYRDIIEEWRTKKMRERKERLRKVLGLNENSSDKLLDNNEEKDAEHQESEISTAGVEDAEPGSS